MSKLCLNCTEIIPDNKEFCDICDAELNEMVDAKKTAIPANLVDTNVNPLFQTRNVTGSIVDGDPDLIANRVNRDDKGSFGYWQYVLLFILIMILIVVVAN